MKLTNVAERIISSAISLKPLLLILGILFFFQLPAENLDSLSTLSATAESIEVIQNQTVGEVIPLEGFSFSSLVRGLIGLVSLLILAFLFSANRKGINWRTVGVGLLFQIIIAIGVLKVTFIQNIFEFVGKVFVKILEFTQAGSQFLFDGLVADTESFLLSKFYQQ